MKAERISIVVPNYNNEKYLRNCIESIVRQTYPVTEVIIVDDCSTDRSVEVIQELQQRYKDYPIRFMALEENKGVSHARNTGLYAAEGKYITFLDADDSYFDEYKIANEMELIKKYEEMQTDIAAYSRVIHVDEEGELIGNTQNGKVYNGNLFMKLLKTVDTTIIPRDYCIKADILRQAGGYREDMSLYEDYELTLRISKSTAFYHTEKAGTAYRIKNRGLSDRPWWESDKVFLKIFFAYVKGLPFLSGLLCCVYKIGSWLLRRAKITIYEWKVNLFNKGN